MHVERTVNLAMAVGCIALLALKLALLPRVNVNWDEFLFLSRIHDQARGALPSLFQTFHVHLFGWVADPQVNEVDQVVAGRRVMFGLRSVGSLLLLLVGWRLYGVTGALVAVVASLSLSYGWRHGEAFRADPVIAFLFLVVAVSLLFSRHRSALGVASVPYAVALLVSAKSVFLAPAIVGLVFVRARALRRAAVDTAVFGFATASVYLVLHAYHAAAGARAAAGVTEQLAAVAPRMWLEPQTRYLLQTLQADWLLWALVGIGIAIAVHDATRAASRRIPALCVAAFGLPLLSLAIYRNTFPYHFVTLLPAMALICGFTVVRIADTLRIRELPFRWVAPVVATALLISALPAAHRESADSVSHQRQVIATVRTMFPEPVPYIDRGGMLASYPRVGPFMSTFVMEAYRERGIPQVPEIVRSRQPAFVLANVLGLELAASRADEVAESPYRLLTEDYVFLQRNFIHHWGPVWVPGVTVTFSAAVVTTVEVPVAGTYLLESQIDVEIDGQEYRPGDRIPLAAGTHTIRGVHGAGQAVLRRADPPPASRPPDAPLFVPL